MKKIPVSKEFLQTMIQQLTDLEEQKNIILDQYYPEPTLKRTNFEKMLDNYMNHLESFIKSARVTDSNYVNCPFVVVGSHVEVIDVEENESYTLRVVSPLTDKATISSECVSYLSPIGSSLLLKKINDEFQVETPSHLSNYKVNNIWIMDA